MLTIDKNIPIPQKIKPGNPMSEFTKTCLAMDVGDSIFVNIKQKEVHGKLQTAKKAGLKFTTRNEGEGTRIWRVA